MQNAQWIESGQWVNELQPMYVDYSDLGISSKAQQHFFKAMVAYEKGLAAEIDKEIEMLEKQIRAAELVISDQGIAMCSSGSTRYAPSKSDIVRANVMINQMKAMAFMIVKDDSQTEKNLQKATALEDDAEYSYGPPDITYPSYEQYGDWLLTKNRPKEALVQFDKSLVTAKNRAKALKGKITAFTMLNKAEEAKAVKEILEGFWKPDELAMN
jgi:hypothetical protein